MSVALLQLNFFTGIYFAIAACYLSFYFQNLRTAFFKGLLKAATRGVLKKKGVLRNFTKFAVKHLCQRFSKDHYYCLLLKLWDKCLKEFLDAGTTSRIIVCKVQMKTFNFFFGLCLGQRHHSFIDNLSKTLQKEKMPAVSGQRLASLTAKTI